MTFFRIRKLTPEPVHTDIQVERLQSHKHLDSTITSVLDQLNQAVERQSSATEELKKALEVTRQVLTELVAQHGVLKDG